ncbi:S1/P1 nuclease [uncultured Alistipes sp.]|jgi:S1/P1 nuclease|uniref:S1/P1 nuclease n=1 Tax=uncultured Alistipes sp. TaxID=538949 RepID=UPI0025E7BA29|nr:S1/P1 nuclease [uncultured Alistipes sp.]
MKKLIFILITAFLTLCIAEPALGWGREGHETIAKIAERNLTKRARKRIEHYLGGHSIVYYAKWMDEYRHTPEYAFTNDWHTVPVDASLRYDDSLLNPQKGNAVYGLELAIANLENYRNLTDSAVSVNLKYIIHLVGDMHCPAHIKYTTHNMKYDVMFEDKYRKPHKFYVHHVWDNEIITTTRIWSVTEWAEELDRASRQEKAAIAAGTARDWLHDSAVKCEVQFEWAKPDERLGQDFLNKAVPLVESQILSAGYRLARLLNELFD